MKIILIIFLMIIVIVLEIMNIKKTKRLIKFSLLEKDYYNLEQNYSSVIKELEIFKDIPTKEAEEMFLSSNAYKAVERMIRDVRNGHNIDSEVLNDLITVYERYDNSKYISKIKEDRGTHE